jgi:hypothetical protein
MGFSTKFCVKVLAACQNKSAAALLEAGGLDLRAKAEDDKELDSLLAEFKVSL